MVLPRAADVSVGVDGRRNLLFVGDDWAEDHHDVEVQDEAGRRLGKARLPEGVAGISRVHELIGRHVPAHNGQPAYIPRPNELQQRLLDLLGINPTQPP